MEARRKPLAFAADALSLWIFNRSLLTINELFHYPAKQMKRSYPAHAQYMAQSSVRGACGFVLADKPPARPTCTAPDIVKSQ